jgi:hypothetical protein
MCCTLAHPQRWETCESLPLGASLKPAKLTVLSANTLDNRRNCRHNHMLGVWRAQSRAGVYAEASAIVYTLGQSRGVTAIAKIAGGLVLLRM